MVQRSLAYLVEVSFIKLNSLSHKVIRSIDFDQLRASSLVFVVTVILRVLYSIVVWVLIVVWSGCVLVVGSDGLSWGRGWLGSEWLIRVDIWPNWREGWVILHNNCLMVLVTGYPLVVVVVSIWVEVGGGEHDVSSFGGWSSCCGGGGSLSPRKLCGGFGSSWKKETYQCFHNSFKNFLTQSSTHRQSSQWCRIPNSHLSKEKT